MNEIDETVLPGLTADDLKDLGVGPVGHRRILLEAIAALRTDTGGKAASAELVTTARAPSVSPEDRAERRQVTVMFSDLVGSTAMSARHHGGAGARAAIGFGPVARPPRQRARIELRRQHRRRSSKKIIAGAAVPLGCQPPMNKVHHRASLKSQSENKAATHHGGAEARAASAVCPRPVDSETKK